MLKLIKEPEARKRSVTGSQVRRTGGAQMTRRRLALVLAIACLILCSYCVIELPFSGLPGSSKGSPALAEQWRAQLAQYTDPVEAKARDPEILVLRFQNGEWAFGRFRRSNDLWLRGGGTVVFKDSKGQTRAFFGYVGRVFGTFTEHPSLEEYYRRLQETGFKEHVFQ
jgi:hypothetical protein